MYLAHRLQHILGMPVDCQGTAVGNAQVSPSALEHMRERQEIEYNIRVRQRQHPLVRLNRTRVHQMRNHHPLGQARCTARVQDISQIPRNNRRRTPLHLHLTGKPTAQIQEFIEIYTDLILRIPDHITVKYYQLLQLRAHLQHTECRIVLILLSHEDDTYAGITHHILDLHLAARGIERNRHRPDTICTEIHKHTLGHVLREYGHILLLLHSQSKHGIRCLIHPLGKSIPGYIPPLLAGIIPITHGHPVAVTAGLVVYQNR